MGIPDDSMEAKVAAYLGCERGELESEVLYEPHPTKPNIHVAVEITFRKAKKV